MSENANYFPFDPPTPTSGPFNDSTPASAGNIPWIGLAATTGVVVGIMILMLMSGVFSRSSDAPVMPEHVKQEAAWRLRKPKMSEVLIDLEEGRRSDSCVWEDVKVCTTTAISSQTD